MSAEENIEIVRRIYREVFDNHHVAVVDRLYTENYVYHSPGYPDFDREGLKQGFTSYLTAFPDAKMKVEDIFAAGDKVASRYTCVGTQQEPYEGIPASHKQITMSAILIQRFEGSRIAEDWEWSDTIGFMKQVGAISVPGFDSVPLSPIRYPQTQNTLSPAENIAIVRRVVDEFNRGNLDILDEVCSPDYVFHGPINPDWDRDSIKGAIGMMHKAFPDWKITVGDIFATADKAAYRISIVGTHLGELWGVSPTGKQMTWTAQMIDHFADGKIVEEWEWTDFLGLVRQLGLVPELVGA